MRLDSSRIIYILLFLILLFPLVTKDSLVPAYNQSAKKTFDYIEALPEKNGYGLLFFDYGPGTQAENHPQATVMLEHALRKKIPTIVLTTYALGEKFTQDAVTSVVERLNKESFQVTYGVDYVVLGYRPGANLFLQGISQSTDLASYLGKDIKGQAITTYEAFKDLKHLSQVSVLAEFTGLVGFLSSYIQFLTIDGKTAPIIHGCTSITIPETYIYSDTGQIRGTLEGLSGAAYYSHLLQQRFKNRVVDDSMVINTALGVGQIFILLLVLLGNVLDLIKRRAL